MIINEIWNRKTLLWNFAISDLKIRYRNSALGFLWTILEPLLMLLVLYIVFTNIFNTKIEHFGMYLLVGIIMWNMLSRGTEIGLNSIVSRSGLVKQIYFPREIPVISAVLTSLMMLSFEFIVFGIFTVVFQFIPPPSIIFLPLVLLLEFILVLGISLPLAVLNVRYRDIQFIWRIVLQAGFFLTPIFYKIDVLPENIKNIIMFSPIVQIIDIGHNIALYDTVPTLDSVIIAVGTTCTVFFVGYLIFRKSQKGIIEEL